MVDFLFIVTLIVGVCNCSMFCCTFLYDYSSIAIILMGKGELVALLNLSSWCLVMVERLFLVVPRSCLQFVIVVFPDHNNLLFLLDLSYTFSHYLITCFLTAVRHEVNNLESSVVAQELELAINLVLKVFMEFR